MQFEYEGVKYRIVFRYSKPEPALRRWVVEQMADQDTRRFLLGDIVILGSELKPVAHFGVRVLRELDRKIPPRRMTTCEIQRWDESVSRWVPSFAASTTCSHQDQFRKEYARRMSLGRALGNIDETSALYGKVMAAYYGRKKGGK